MWLREKRFEPEFDKSTRDSLYEGWQTAVRRVQSE
jgi:glycerol kinase